MKKEKEKEMVVIGNTLLSLMEDFVYLASKVNSLEDKIEDPEEKLELRHCVRHIAKLEKKFDKLADRLRRVGVISKDLLLELSNNKSGRRENNEKDR